MTKKTRTTIEQVESEEEATVCDGCGVEDEPMCQPTLDPRPTISWRNLLALSEGASL